MRVVLGVTGCIAAYKAAIVLRELQERGVDILPVMTPSARRFLAPLTLEKLSGRPVVTDLFEDASPRIEHIALARESDLLLVAPASANVLGKFARGIADDFLSTLYLSTLTPVVVAPSMNVEMWKHPAVRENLRILESRGVRIVEPGSGYLACGEVGEGRLAEPEEIARTALEILRPGSALSGRRVLVTAGPTVEDFDAVRFLSNRSSGKMGFAIAAEAARRGGTVTLISGPVQLETPRDVERVDVRSADQMAEAVLARFDVADVVVMAAAVSDFAPAAAANRKIKKKEAETLLQLRPTTDILATLGRRKSDRILIGFAAETGALEEAAKAKLISKNLDLILANDVSLPDRGFQSDHNEVLVLERGGGKESWPLLPKSRVAELLWDRIESLLARRPGRVSVTGE